MPGVALSTIQSVIDEELDRLRQQPPELRELQRVVNQTEASFYRQMERVGSYRGKAEQLNAYHAAGGGPDYFAEDLARFTSLSPSDIQAAVEKWLPTTRRVELMVEPEARR
jgi:zinc protease